MEKSVHSLVKMGDQLCACNRNWDKSTRRGMNRKRRICAKLNVPIGREVLIFSLKSTCQLSRCSAFWPFLLRPVMIRHESQFLAKKRLNSGVEHLFFGWQALRLLSGQKTRPSSNKQNLVEQDGNLFELNNYYCLKNCKVSEDFFSFIRECFILSEVLKRLKI